MSDPVAGSYRVTSCGLPHDMHSSVETHRMEGVVSAPGVIPTATELWRGVPHRRWPHIGDVLPVFVDRANPTKIRVRWQRVPRRDWTADARRPYIPQKRVSAERLAAEMRKHQR